jgi:hypothetical protein
MAAQMVMARRNAMVRRRRGKDRCDLGPLTVIEYGRPALEPFDQLPCLEDVDAGGLLDDLQAARIEDGEHWTDWYRPAE